MEQTLKSAKPLGRRSFLKGTGLGLAGAAFAGMASPKLFAQSSPDLDTAIAQFALNLEYLEAEFYTIATTGKTLEESGFDVSGVGESGQTTGGQKVDFSGELSGRLPAIAAEITYDEQQHVLGLRQLLGSNAIAKPAINLDALGMGFASFKQFLALARAFEDNGSSAYGGAAPLITSKENLALAVRVNITEAMHVSLLRGLIAVNNVPTTPLDSLDVLPPPSGSKYFTVNNQALGVVRTTSEVLAIVYGNSTKGTNKGGFFPNGVNGPINTV